MKAGALQSLPLRQLITPRPNSPPKMNAAFFIPGMTTTHSAFAHISSGMPLSVLRRSVTTDAAWLSRVRSALEIEAMAAAAVTSDRTHAIAMDRVTRSCMETPPTRGLPNSMPPPPSDARPQRGFSRAGLLFRRLLALFGNAGLHLVPLRDEPAQRRP